MLVWISHIQNPVNAYFVKGKLQRGNVLDTFQKEIEKIGHLEDEIPTFEVQGRKWNLLQKNTFSTRNCKFTACR